jgi:hypothetical protein
MPMLNKSKTLTGTVPVCLVHAPRATTKSADGKRDARVEHKTGSSKSALPAHTRQGLEGHSQFAA